MRIIQRNAAVGSEIVRADLFAHRTVDALGQAEAGSGYAVPAGG